MWRATLRSLVAYKLRLALSALAIVLGVAFVAGTFVFTDSLKQAFNDLTKGGQADLVVEPATSFDSRFTEDVAPLTLPDTLVSTIAGVPEAAAAAGVVQVQNVIVLGPDGKPVGGQAGPGSIGSGESWIVDPSLQEWKLVSGVAGEDANSVVVDETTATDAGLTVGAPVTVLLPDGTTVTPTVTGIAEPTLARFGPGGSVVLWDLASAQTLLGTPGQVSNVRVAAAPDVTQNQLQAAVAPLLPANAVSQTGEQISSDISEQLDERLSFLNTFLLVFGLISLFVSAFLIYNTFSILVAQRTKELALLRAIGATRSQVSRAVLVEALAVALVATTVGLVLGAGVAVGLKAFFAAAGAPLPGSGLVFLPRTFMVSYAIGVIITLVSAFIPAQRASAIPPVAAMREESTPAAKSLVTRGVVGGVLVVVAIGLAVVALTSDTEGSTSVTLVGLSALSALLGALALAPVVALVLVPLLGAPFRSAIGALAKENARRNPRRTAATAGALMIGLALISAMSVLAASTVKSTDAVVDDVIGADFVILGSSFQPFPPAVYTATSEVPGVNVATYARTALAQVPGGDGDGSFITVIDPALISEVLTLTMVSGSLADLETPGTVVVDSGTATDQRLAVGDELTFTTLTGEVPVRVVGTYESAGFFSGFAAGYATGDLLGAPNLDTAIYLEAAPDADLGDVRAGLEAAIAPYPIVTLQDQSELKDQIRSQINQLFAFIIALLVLAVFIAFLGIINTLALSVFERTREIGLLRAVGTTRAQVRRMILIESVLIAVLGGVLGLVLGVAYGVGLQRVLADDGISELGIDVPQLLMFLVVSAVGGVVAALWPAYRAAKLNVLAAIATE